MAWTYVILAGIVEIFWVIGLRYSSTVLHWVGTAIMIVLSFYFIIQACARLPSGTVYAVFTGMGAAAIVLIDFLVFGAEFSMMKVVFIGLIITGVIGIKLTTDDESDENRQSDQVGEGGR